MSRSDPLNMTATRAAHGNAKAGTTTAHYARPAVELTPQLQLTLELPPPKPLQPKSRKQPGHQHVKEPVIDVDQMLTMRDVLTITRRHRATIYRWIAAGLFPAPREYKGHQIGWVQSDIENWQGQRSTDTPAE